MKNRRLLNRKVFGGLFVLAVLVAAGVAWKERTALLAWYYVQGLANCSEQEREPWIERTVSLDDKAVPRLLDCLRQDDPRACANAGAALQCLSERWGPRDRRSVDLANRLAENFARLSPAGQEQSLAVVVAALHATSVEEATELAPAASRLLQQAKATVALPAVQKQALSLAACLTAAENASDIEVLARELARAGLADADLDVRVRAIQLVAALETRPAPRQAPSSLLVEVVRLLSDKAPRVRREAMLAVGPVPAVITTDELVRWLHDPDAEVRQACEHALKQRGVKGPELTLARLISDDKPAARLQVVQTLAETGVEPSTWLRRLTLDSDPAVRAAALRMAGDPTTDVDLTDRLEQMVGNDPSPTVRQLAQYYLTHRKARAHPFSASPPSAN